MDGEQTAQATSATGVHEAAKEPRTSGLSPRLTLLLAIACGLAVGNVYNAQPLLETIAAELGIPLGSVGIIGTITQVGYGLGLVFIVPLGDVISRRSLALWQFILSAAVLLVAGFAGTRTLFLVAAGVIGLLAVVVQVLVALAASLAVPEQRGRALGLVTGGVVTGILAARVLAGFIADVAGWRAVYFTSAGAMMAMAALLFRALPQEPETRVPITYAGLLRSMAELLRRDRTLRLRAGFAFLIFATFSTFWTAVALPLGREPFMLSHAQVGLLGFAGVVGALVAGGAGRLVDRGFGTTVTGAALGLMLLSWLLLAMLPISLAWLVGGVVLLDLAVQAVHVTNQSLLVSQRPEAAGRLIGMYMVFYSLGSATGAIASTAAYAQAGWPGVCSLGAALSSGAVLLWILASRRRHAHEAEVLPH
ncbi:MFS transporter [Pseudoroseomonas ludipueritiae]|uniref:MFS transporter n=1 Tax=Pseudoroseomonas ludipueritiae TaxID=198093 RepID=A0ABR7RBX6_9PROT|nr:MFS transporter [Pseudoroseomonas ludipueritiae]MBC9179082.1 MFS transporter [Pseudoroseomonas ludipueritiae]